MSPEIADSLTPSLFSRLISRRRSPWLTAGIGLLLILAPLLAAALDGVLGDLFRAGHWRIAFVRPAVILYILIVSPILARLDAEALRSFRPVVQVDEAHLARVVAETSRIRPAAEGLAFAVGGGVGLWFSAPSLSGGGAPWLKGCLFLLAALMFGLLAWTIYAAVTSTRLMAALHRQPLRFDLFDPKPFRPIGRYSLAVALVFVGGIALSMLFSVGTESLWAWQNWAASLILLSVPVAVFFLNMRGTHRVLAAEKGRELEGVQGQILDACRTLMRRREAGEPAAGLAAEINALVAYEQRVRAASTWPYDTAMLRTLFFALIIPAVTGLVRGLSEVLFH